MYQMVPSQPKLIPSCCKKRWSNTLTKVVLLHEQCHCTTLMLLHNFLSRYVVLEPDALRSARPDLRGGFGK